MPLPKLKNLFVSETRLRFCAIDSQISFLALAIGAKKNSKTISETHAKWLQFGAVSETQGLAEIIETVHEGNWFDYWTNSNLHHLL